MNTRTLLFFLAWSLIPFLVFGTQQDSLIVFKERSLSKQHHFLKERLYALENVSEYIEAFLAEAMLKKDTSYISEAYYFSYRIHRKSKTYTKAHEAIDTAISLAIESNKDSLLGSYYHAKGATFYIQSNYTDALDYYLKAYDIMRTKSAVENRLTLQFDIATIKLKGRKTDEALTAFTKIIRSYDSLIQTKPDSRFLKIRFIKMLNNTAKWYTEEEMYEKALDLYTKSLRLSKQIHFSSGTCIAIGGKGNVYTEQQQYEKAIETLNEALQISTQDNTLRLVTPFLLLDKGKCLFGLKQYEAALKNFEETAQIIETRDLQFIELDETYQFLAKTHVQLNNHEKATEVYDQYIERKNLSADKRFELYQTIFEGYDLKNAALKANKAEATSNLFRKYFIQTVIVACVLVFAAMIFFVYYRNVQKQKTAKFHALIETLKNKETKPVETATTGYVLSDEKAAKILERLDKLEAKLFFLDNKYNLSTLAKKCQTNSSYLSKVINQYKEKTFSEYMADMRIDYVLKALKNDKKLRSYTIQSIAEEIGFKKSESFAKAFKKRTGFNPSFYIKSLENV